MHRLMIGAHGDGPDRRLPGQAFKGLNDLIPFWPTASVIDGFFVCPLQSGKGIVGAICWIVRIAAEASFHTVHKFLLEGIGLRVWMLEVARRGSRKRDHTHW